MSSNIFMRGQFDLSNVNGFFMAARKSDGTIFIYREPPDPPDPPSLLAAPSVQKSYGAFTSTKFADGDPHPKIVHLNKHESGGFTIKSNLIPGGPSTFFTTKKFGITEGVVEVADDAKNDKELIMFLKTSQGENLPPGTIWSGVWYKTFSIEKNKMVPLIWKQFDILDSTQLVFKGEKGPPIASNESFEIMFIPRGGGTDGNIYTWDINRCKIYEGGPDISMQSFSEWVLGIDGSSGCNSGTWLVGPKAVGGVTGCHFVSKEECEKGYIYSYCKGTDECGKCMGICKKDGPCSFDYDPSIRNLGDSPLSCKPKYTKTPTLWSKYGKIIIIIIIVSVIIILSLVIGGYVWLSSKRGKKIG